ncbi:hypothetical protein KC207_05030 [Phycicoccus sp. BSK3Z-2]|uniref:DUF4245 domain-containing protein n=1 Tax=Phycicoccus avicenniae TaxID=2828860 RepID=A0A941D891_9MICO|nr:hypothetical protein [Phycicoccus avicenniae]MBR7742650.1 hypothetical protein [Phycicoccus avicenniae]
MTTMRTVAALLAGLGLAVTTGCSGGTAGYSEVEVGHLTLERPESWSEEPATGELWTQRYVGDGMELQVSGEFSTDPTASAAYSRLDLPATVQLEGYEGSGVDNATVEGADTAVRSDFTYTEDGTPHQGVWVIAGQWPSPSTAAIAITGETLDATVVDQIIASLRFSRTGGGS